MLIQKDFHLGFTGISSPFSIPGRFSGPGSLCSATSKFEGDFFEGGGGPSLASPVAIPHGSNLENLPRNSLLIPTQGAALAGALDWFDTKKARSSTATIESPHFRIGESVRSRFHVSPQTENDRPVPNTLRFTVSEAIVGDIRHSDQFEVEVSPEDYRIILEQGLGFNVDAVLEVSGNDQKGHLISNMFQYQARAKALNIDVEINPPQEKIDRAPLGEHFYLEGRVVSYQSNKNYPYENAKMVIATPHGQTYTIQLRGGYVAIEQSLLENQNGKGLQPGDVVRVNALIGKYGDFGKQKVALLCDFCRSVYLVKAGPERQAAFDTLRSKVEAGIQEIRAFIAKQEYVQARKAFSQVVKNELTIQERTALEEILTALPVEERPMVVFGNQRTFTAKVISEMFHVDTDAMTLAEFLEFCDQVVTLKLKIDPKSEHKDLTYLYRLMRELKIPTNQVEEIYLKAATHTLARALWYNRVQTELVQFAQARGQVVSITNRGLSLVGEQEQLVEFAIQEGVIPRERKAILLEGLPFEDEYFLGHTLGYLARLGSTRAIQALLSIAKSIILDAVSLPRIGLPSLAVNISHKIASALDEVAGTEDLPPEQIRLLVAHLDFLRSLANKAESLGEDMSATQIRKAIHSIETRARALSVSPST